MATGSRLGPCARTAFGVPRQLYRHNLGWLLGRRFVQLEHVGRRSGITYTTVLEVLRYQPDRREIVVMSGFGWDADWLSNLIANGHATIHIASETYRADVRPLSVDAAVAVFAAYERRNRLVGPIIRNVLSELLGWRYDGSPAAMRRVVQQHPLIAFHPVEDASSPLGTAFDAGIERPRHGSGWWPVKT